ncbi:hypothetical protein I79_018040 [Cricetulus griseus]|uniref:Uncharacterized protein n=1 Tax=Cricetulus griseus TaxID=10029 RepID=G3I3N0_CRIGR|nr:hypothetical protein I79_018040 [Cricetulus griseus]
MVACFNSSTQEAEAGGSLRARGQPGLYNELLDRHGWVGILSQTSKGTLYT